MMSDCAGKMAAPAGTAPAAANSTAISAALPRSPAAILRNAGRTGRVSKSEMRQSGVRMTLLVSKKGAERVLRVTVQAQVAWLDRYGSLLFAGRQLFAV